MNKYQMTTAVLAGLSLIAMTGCSINIGDVNIRRLKTGPMQTETINVPMPENTSNVWDVELSPAAAEVNVDAKAEGLVQGTVEYNVPEYKPVVTTNGNRVTIRMDEVAGIPPSDVRNIWKLSLGQGMPMNLTVNTGASRSTWDLGGLSLRSLNWRQGAADASVQFTAPNPESMSNFRCDVGAGNLTIRGLGNANVNNGVATVGAGNLTLYFDGTLSQDLNLTIEGGAATVTINSGGNPVRVTMQNAVAATKSGDWNASSKEYTSPEWENSSGPKVNITMEIGVGTVNLQTGK